MKSHKKNECSRMLRVLYTQDEKLELGKQLAEAHNDMVEVQADLDRVKAEFKSKQTALESKIGTLSNGISTGYKMTDVKCLWLMDAPAPGRKTLVRLDTSNEVERADMTEADKQAEFELHAPEPTPGTDVPEAAKTAAKEFVKNIRAGLKEGESVTVHVGGSDTQTVIDKEGARSEPVVETPADPKP